MATPEQKKESLADFVSNQSQSAPAPSTPSAPQSAPQLPQDPTAPDAQAQSPNPQQALATAQPPQTQQMPTGLQGMFGKDVPESMTTSLLRGMFNQSPTIQPQIQPFKDDSSPARNVLTSVVNGLTSGFMGQKFMVSRAQKYKEWHDLQELRLMQQQRDQQMQIGQMNNAVKYQRDQNNTQFKNLQAAINQEKDKTRQTYLQNVFDANYGQNGLKYQQFKQLNDRYEALKEHMQNQDSTDESKLDPRIKDPAYLRATVLNESQPQFADREDDPNVKLAFLKSVETTTMAIKAREAQMKAQSAQKPPQAQMIGPDGRSFLVTPGTQVPPGSQTLQGVNAVSTPTTVTRHMIESAPKVLALVNRQLGSLDQLESKFGPIAGRAADFKNGKIGLPGYGYSRFKANGGLLETGLMNMHIGNKGSEGMMEHFHNLIGGMNQDPSNARESLEAIRDYAQGVMDEGKQSGMNLKDFKLGGAKDPLGIR